MILPVLFSKWDFQFDLFLSESIAVYLLNLVKCMATKIYLLELDQIPWSETYRLQQLHPKIDKTSSQSYKTFFFANEEFFSFLLVSLQVCYK